MIGPRIALHTVHSMAQAALLLSIFLWIFSETLLSPFYPQFFRSVFGIADVGYAGYYIFACRLTVILCAPLWGALARRVTARHLLLVGQAGAAVITALMASARDAGDFLVLSVVLLTFKSSYLLLYPLLVQMAGQEQRAATVSRYQMVLHAAVILSALAGAWMVNLSAPLRLFYAVAATDVVQLILCALALRSSPTRAQLGDAPGGRVDAPASNPAIPGAGSHSIGATVALGFVIVTFHLASNVVRPYFTAYLQAQAGLSLAASSLLFLAPHTAAIGAMLCRGRTTLGKRPGKVYLLHVSLLGLSLSLQGWSSNLAAVLVGRLLYGFSLVIAQAALEIHVFASGGQRGLYLPYTLAASAQNGGLLGAPLLASSLVRLHGLLAPLLAAGAICLINLLVAMTTVFHHPARMASNPRSPRDCQTDTLKGGPTP